jgi:hypothetical protein
MVVAAIESMFGVPSLECIATISSIKAITHRDVVPVWIKIHSSTFLS